MTRIYQLDTINTVDIQPDHVAPIEDSAGNETVKATISQLCNYLFNVASTLGEGSPFDGFNLIIGRESNALGSDSMAIGPMNSVTVGGEGSVTEGSGVGFQNTVSGNWGASGFGYKNHATASRTSAFGHKNIANEAGASALGNGNTASGYASTASGYYNTASGTYTTAVGDANAASGNWGASAVGYRNHAVESQSVAFGHKNVAYGRQSSSVGSANLTTSPDSSAFGYDNIAGNVVWSNNQHNVGAINQDENYFTIDGGNYTSEFIDYVRVWNSAADRGDSAINNDGFYTINNVTFDETNTLVYVNETILNDSVSGYIMGGADQGSSGWGASAVGYKNQADATTASSFGHRNISSDRQASAFGSNNTASGYGSTASGYSNTASADYATASGSYNNASEENASAFGSNNTASGSGSSAFGYSAIARVNNTVNVGGGIIVRGDFGDSSDPLWVFNNFSGVQNVVLSKLVDLTSVADQTVTLPSNCHFFVDEVGLICNDATVGLTVQPTVHFGWTGTVEGLLAAALTTNIDGTAFAREKYTSLLTNKGQTSLTAGVSVAATADALHGRFYWKGTLVENDIAPG